MEQQSGPPSTDRTGDETRSTGRFTRDDEETRSTGRFRRDPDTGPELEAERGADEESRGEVTPPEVLPAPDQPPADAGEASTEAAPIMSNLPHSRPQQRSQKRAAPKKRTAGRQASASKPGRKAASARRQAAGTTPGGRSKGAASSRRSSAPAAAASARSEGLPRRAIGTAVQIAGAPLKLTVAVTREATGLIRRGFRL